MVARSAVSVLGDAVVYLNDPLNWTRTNGLLDRLVEHITISAAATAAAAAIALPLAIWFGHTGRGGGFTVALSNVSRAVPSGIPATWSAAAHSRATVGW